jgi:peptide/nickel transport system substrate-binding protein
VGSYEVTGFLGEGGQGSVYLGVSTSGEQVAIKLLHARFADDEQALRRFRREAESARRVAEFCTARVLDVGALDDQPYIVGEYVDGPSLQHQVTKSGPMGGSALVRLAVTTVTALTAIHDAGVIHRDFKPSNVLLGSDGARVIDFGIARALDVSQSLTTSVVGTPAYMAPEQFTGEATPASDVFAWAGTMVFAAVGRGAFGFGPLPAVIHRILSLDPDLTGVPAALAPLLSACLSKDPRYRPAAARLMRDLIRSGTQPNAVQRPWTPVTVPPPAAPVPAPWTGPETPPTVPPRPLPRRRRAVLVPAGAVATALVLGLASWLFVRTGNPVDPPPAFDAAMTSVVRPSAKKGGTVRLLSSSGLDSTDPGDMYLPQTWNMVRLYGRSLTMFKPAPGAAGIQIVPDLAERLGQAGDGGKTWTYKLRQGLKFQDGRPITAEDVKYAVLRSMDPGFSHGSSHFDLMLDLPAGYQGAYRSADADTDSAIQTPDARTIVFHLRRPSATFDYLAQLPETIPVPKDRDTRDTYRVGVVSSGPYQIEAASLNSIRLERNPNWDPTTDPNRIALPDRYELEYGREPPEVYSALTSGLAEVGSPVSDDTAGAVLGDESLRRQADAPVTSVGMLAINPQVPPFDNLDCRRAVVRALDLNAVRSDLGAQNQVPTSLLPPGIIGERRPDQNLKPGGDQTAARQALIACGHPGGFPATYIHRDVPAEAATARTIQDALGKIGIRLGVRAVPAADFARRYGGNPEYLRKNRIGLIAQSWAPDWPDPESFLASTADSRQIIEKGYSINVSVRHHAIDLLIDQARAEPDAARRAKLWSQVEQQVAEQAVLVPLSWRTSLLLRGRDAANVHVSPVYGDYDLLSMGWLDQATGAGSHSPE